MLAVHQEHMFGSFVCQGPGRPPPPLPRAQTPCAEVALIIPDIRNRSVSVLLFEQEIAFIQIAL